MEEVRLRSSKYSLIHMWLSNTYGKANHCEFCDGSKAKRFEWALITGLQHDFNVNNYIQLCPSCHRKYDMTEEKRLAMKIVSAGTNKRGANPFAKKINMVDINTGYILETFECISDVYDKYKFKRSSISMCLTGKNKTSNGYKWQYV